MKLGTALTLLLSAAIREPRRSGTALAFSRYLTGSLHSPTAFVGASKALSDVPTAFTKPSGVCEKSLYKQTCLSSTATDVEESTSTKPVENFRKDYVPLAYRVSNVSMDIDISEGKTSVTSKLEVNRNELSEGSKEMALDGDSSSVKLLKLKLNGKELVEGTDYTLYPQKLMIHNVPCEEFEVETEVEIVPETNTQLSGLYKSSGMYCSQCEAMGFRRITYFPDRPDNMSTYRVRIEADKDSCPILLSNGNLMEQGTSPSNPSRHYAVWHDPHPKPSYLFAVVAGALSKISSTFTTKSGRTVHLDIYSEPSNVDQLSFAMDSLKKSMKWDEDRFDLEYDLDLFNIVAVNDFNMGAMENKSLNIFNTAYVLTSPRTATDADYENVLAVIGHEYFHNWTGNRVTCRDWFQLTLKEGLTVFRDQEFSSDFMDSPSVKRIEDVKTLRQRQFPEDAGPMKHPIRPDSYISMDNFYTATVYVKGAEIIRMYQTLVGKDGFRKGMDLYFERHDGNAVTCDDFRNAMADANDIDLKQFARWYSTPGTPTLSYKTHYENGKLTLTFTQDSLSTEGPLHIPIAVGVLNKDNGEEIVPTTVLELKENTQTFVFDDLDAKNVVPSILRNFSAPVKLVSEDTTEKQDDTWTFLAAYDTDGFNKWEAVQKLYTASIFKSISNPKLDDKTINSITQAFGNTLFQSSNGGSYSISAYALTLPTESVLAEEMEPPVDPLAIHTARKSVRELLARRFQTDIRSLYNHLTRQEAESFTKDKEYTLDPTSIGRRRLRNTLLGYLCSITDTEEEKESAAELAWRHYTRATCLTDKMAALTNLASMKGTKQRDDALRQFYEDADGDALVINKWFSAQAMADVPDVLEEVKALTQHPDFTLSNPNRCRSLISAFTMNEAAFHAEDGEGYRFLGKVIADVDKLNPQISSRIARALVQWRRYDEKRGEVMKGELETLRKLDGISDDLYEIVTRGLQ